LVLGGAAIQRCDERFALNGGFKAVVCQEVVNIESGMGGAALSALR
jgi:hypothetical protein